MKTGKRDFGTLATEAIAYEGLTRIQAADGEAERAEALAETVLAIFRDYYRRSQAIPRLAKRAFEARAWPEAVRLSQERLAIYSVSIQGAVPILKHAVQEQDRTGGLWHRVEASFGRLVAADYEADLATAYLSSLRRWVYRDSWIPIHYASAARPGDPAEPPFLRRMEATGRMTADLVDALLDAVGLDAPWRDRGVDAARAAERVNAELSLDRTPDLRGVEVVTAGFFRNRGAYVIGAVDRASGRGPLALALLHGTEGVYIDAVILRETTLRHVFSSTLANFHVPVAEYHALVDYLHGLMPARPRGLHYSTVGYNHVGKMAVMEQVTQGPRPLDHAPGPRGSVAMAFTAEGSGYILKVIRDTPSASYKWERWDGVESVLAKYREVHELNRSGSMLDNILYYNVLLPEDLFAEPLLEDLLCHASGSVSRYRGQVFFTHLIAQQKLVPVPLYLAQCTEDEAAMVVIRLGQCIRNNAATDVFNRDLDGRNYGVSGLRFVYLFDYDAVMPLTDVKIRTNADRFDGEEDVPDWFFEEGPVFLPEELEAHLRLPSRRLRRLFREAHGELLTAAYWERMQGWLREGRVPRVRTYPRSTQLTRDGAENLTLLTLG